MASLLSKQSVYVNYIIATSKNCVTEKNQSSRGYLPVVLVSSSIRKERGSRIQSAYVGYLPNRERIHILPETEKKVKKKSHRSLFGAIGGGELPLVFLVRYFRCGYGIEDLLSFLGKDTTFFCCVQKNPKTPHVRGLPENRGVGAMSTSIQKRACVKALWDLDTREHHSGRCVTRRACGGTQWRAIQAGVFRFLQGTGVSC